MGGVLGLDQVHVAEPRAGSAPAPDSGRLSYRATAAAFVSCGTHWAVTVSDSTSERVGEDDWPDCTSDVDRSPENVTPSVVVKPTGTYPAGSSCRMPPASNGAVTKSAAGSAAKMA